MENGLLDSDGGMLFVGPGAERRFGRRHFSALTASFTAPPQFTVLAGRQEIGRTDTAVLTEERDGPLLLLLGGRSRRVTSLDWKRRGAYVEPAEGGGVARWNGGVAGLSVEPTRAMREVLPGAEPPVSFPHRARDSLDGWRRDGAPAAAHRDGTLVTRDGTGRGGVEVGRPAIR
ncbi:hypothetical protein [Streptomonospora wellingtoniae]|uniref:Uncharacterized protein n=1 Tax=Streptomonospora wellingtoniae TaxID=3075544 RepID=A0ABU2KWE7_9ACTN|nr:hypothetical protein [Streptomonospora sp. DSM 45055]MDT0303536.1 hypothetical protein [Streptomonospora sp. DSM 45055]